MLRPPSWVVVQVVVGDGPGVGLCVGGESAEVVAAEGAGRLRRTAAQRLVAPTPPERLFEQSSPTVAPAGGGALSPFRGLRDRRESGLGFAEEDRQAAALFVGPVVVVDAAVIGTAALIPCHVRQSASPLWSRIMPRS